MIIALDLFGSFVYESKTTLPANTPKDNYTNKLQFTSHEEGRIRALYDNSAMPNTLTGFAYDYMIKDHLGNVRVVLTDELKQNTYPAATLEGTFDLSTNSMVNYEKGFYKIDNTKIVLKTSIPSWTPPVILKLLPIQCCTIIIMATHLPISATLQTAHQRKRM